MKRYLYPLVCLLLISCQADKVYLYEVNEVEVRKAGVDKNNLKSNFEFLSLAYSDLIGETLPNNVLNEMVAAYESVGDKELVADIIIRNILNAPSANVPDESSMRADPTQFVIDTFKKFYIREPTEYELWYFENLINSDPDLTPEIVYYAFLTSDEYRYY